MKKETEKLFDKEFPDLGDFTARSSVKSFIDKFFIEREGARVGTVGDTLEKYGEWSLTKPQNDRDMHSKGFIEAICSHGVGHHNGIHGCDGCCEHCPKDIWSQVSED